jgi:dethiobiotin synthetase
MMQNITVVSGTGTGVGKTHICEALILALRRGGRRAVGLKPIESGFEPGRSDSDRLAAASAFHVKHDGLRFRAAVSPHLAARLEGAEVSLDRVARLVQEAAAVCESLVIELPGGLFTPLNQSSVNADMVRLIEPRHLVMVSVDRLGVLHDTISAMRAASAESLSVSAVVLTEPDRVDASTGTNIVELQIFIPHVMFLSVPRAEANELAGAPAIAKLARLVGG